MKSDSGVAGVRSTQVTGNKDCLLTRKMQFAVGYSCKMTLSFFILEARASKLSFFQLQLRPLILLSVRKGMGL